jgi:hypothetical protein
MSSTGPRLRELIQRAITDDAFANEFLANPSAVAKQYNLEPHHIDKVRELAAQGLFSRDVEPHSGTPAYY